MFWVPAILALIGGAYAVYKNWDEIKTWLTEGFKAVKQFFAEKMKGIAHAAQILGEKVRNAVAEIKYKIFSKEGDKWYESMARREVPESEVPSFIRARIAQQEVDITNEMELELGVKV